VALRDLGPFKSPNHAKKNMVEAVKSVADALGNTSAVCRKCYVHPAIFVTYLDGSLIRILSHHDGHAH